MEGVDGDLQTSIHNLLDRVSTLKGNVLDKMGTRYVKFVPVVIQSKEILQDSSRLEEDIQSTVSRFDNQTKQDIEELSSELTNLKDSLIESSVIVDVISKLCRIHDGLNRVKQLMPEKNHYETAKSMKEICDLLSERSKDLDFLSIYDGLTFSVAIKRTDHSRYLVGKWKEAISWHTVDSKAENGRYHFMLTIAADKPDLENILKTLELYDLSPREMSTFSENLLTKFLKPVIRTDCSVSTKSCRAIRELTVQGFSSSKADSYLSVLENLKSVFVFLEKWLGFEMHQTNFISCLGSYIADDFIQDLIDECLTSAIPSRKEHLRNYASIIEPIINFQSFLIEIGFLPSDSKVLESYFGDSDTLFLNKTIEKYFDSARSLMKKDLHVIKVYCEEPMKPDARVNIKTERDQPLPDNIDKLCPNLFKFPNCTISQSAEDIVILIKDILKEASESDSKVSLELYSLARDIVSMYPKVVRMHHSNSLQVIPRASALLHNNLMYLAHQVMIFDYDKKLSENPPIACFTDLIIPLREEARDVLMLQIQNQQKFLLSLIKESGLGALSEYEVLPSNTEKRIVACIMQCSHLKTIWAEVLPSQIYTNVIGGLCVTIIEELSNRIVATSDMRADIASALARVLTKVQSDLPSLFLDANDVYTNVNNWSKLKELILVLGASLAEVGERWADGKGPLAAEFSAVQVRQMIKALFQVSERRAAILSRIK